MNRIMNMLKSQIKKSFRVLLVVGAVVLPMIVQAQEVATITGSNLRLEARLDTLYMVSPVLNPYIITTRVDSGTAYLAGTVGETAAKDLAEELAQSIDGIQSVQNNIVVDESAITTAARNRSRLFLQKVADATATAQIKGKLEANRNTSGIDATVSTNTGIVTLKGTVRSVQEKDIAGRVASNTYGIRGVDNQLQLLVEKEQGRAALGRINLDKMTSNAGSAIKDVADDLGDAWIDTKVMSSLVFTRGIETGGISVKADNGVVTLSGDVPSEAERNLAKRIAMDVRGVKEVKNQLTVR